MRMTRDDFAEMMRANQRKAVVRDMTSEEIAAQVDAYLARGGVIEQVGVGVMVAPAGLPSAFGGVQQSRAGRAAQIARQQSSKVGITAASRELHVAHRTIQARIDRGDGPPYSESPSGKKEFDLFELREWGRAQGFIK